MPKEFEKPFEDLSRDELAAGIREHFQSLLPPLAAEPVFPGTEKMTPEVQDKVAAAYTESILKQPGTATDVQREWLRAGIAAFAARGDE